MVVLIENNDSVGSHYMVSGAFRCLQRAVTIYLLMLDPPALWVVGRSYCNSEGGRKVSLLRRSPCFPPALALKRASALPLGALAQPPASPVTQIWLIKARLLTFSGNAWLPANTDERQKQPLDKVAGLKADSLRKDALIEDLTNKYVALETHLERLEQGNRVNNVMLFTVLRNSLVRVRSTA